MFTPYFTARGIFCKGTVTAYCTINISQELDICRQRLHILIYVNNRELLPFATRYRSTRGASKQRRDLINGEIERLKDLLPLSETIRQRLFQLQVMSLVCIYIRKERYLPHSISNSSNN